MPNVMKSREFEWLMMLSEFVENCQKQQAITRHKKTNVGMLYIPILKYSSDNWTLSLQMAQRLQAAEMWFY